jgi:hypothetical protein
MCIGKTDHHSWLFRRPWHEGAARLALARQDPSAEGPLSRRPTPSPQFKRGRLPTGSAHSLPKLPEQVTTPGYQEASLSAVSLRFVSDEQSISSGRIAAGRFEGRCSIQLGYGIPARKLSASASASSIKATS